jgi:hypothetical protein
MLFGLPFTLFSTLWMKLIVRGKPLPLNEKIFSTIGLRPIPDHYYQPLINTKKHLKYPLNQDRLLIGISWNLNKQLELLNSFDYEKELIEFP